ncbi:SulP family inorganic anion transporter [Vicingus serpentipes]|uniref:SulP family inorganic anion transporter n=1 Tax=Vicingus serpentipes TaxID=1926625 RepID=A0A5C6RSW7_9FLAO|nr:SulP family inorganic anion transporter [Vicingus serpentipes]TXB65149.1 SulP family inorganic anion transporter [Vicingus serpentipes]
MKNGFDFKKFKYDLPAGLVVFLVALPLCLGIALASTGDPSLLFSGVISGIVGGIIVGFVSGSPLGVSGPAAGLTAIVLTSIETLGTFEAFLMAVVLSGIIQIILGLLKAGIIGFYFPSSVIKGMLAAIGLILILKQIPHALGFDKDAMGDSAFLQVDGHNTFSEIFYAFQFPSTGAIIISLISLLLLIVFETKAIKKISLFKFVPGALIVVVLGIILNQFFMGINESWVLNGEHLVALPVATTLSEIGGLFTFPDFKALGDYNTYIIALTIAIVASLETLLCVEATDKLDPLKRVTPTNRELLAQGTGNMISGFIGGLPLTQVIVRSSANINSGGKTKVSAIFHGLLLLICALLLPELLNKIPLSSLAAILLFIGYKLTKVSLYKQVYKLGWEQFMPFLTTILAILFTDLLKGIGVGLVVAVFYILRRNFRTPYSTKEGDKIHIYLSEDVTFLNKASILMMLEGLPKDSKVILDGAKSESINYDVVEIINDFKNYTAKQKSITLELINIPEIN